MDSRLFASGIGTTGVGLGVLALLATTGALRHPAAATERTAPLEFLAIGLALLVLTVGILATFLGFVRPGIDGAADRGE